MTIIVGSVLAAVVAIALSPFTLIGPARQLEPSPGIAFDWTVLTVGPVALIITLLAFTAVSAFRNAPHTPR